MTTEMVMPNEETGSRTAFVGGDRMCYFLKSGIQQF